MFRDRRDIDGRRGDRGEDTVVAEGAGPVTTDGIS